MNVLRKCIMVLALLSMLTVVLAGCSGGGGSNSSTSGSGGNGGGGGVGGGTATGLTITGTVTDVSGTNVPAAGVLVTLRKADHSTIMTTTSASDGTFAFSNVPASTDVYINVSKANYVSFNTPIFTLISNLNLSGHIIIANETVMKGFVDGIYGSAGGASWSDPFYQGKGWFGMDLYSSGNPMPGITVTAAPSGTAIVYNNGSDVFTPMPPTVGENNSSLVAGYNTTQSVYTFTMTTSSATEYAKMPLVPGEITFYGTESWGQGVTLSGVMADNSGTSSVPSAGLQVTARHPSDTDNSNPIAQATTAADGSFSLTVPSGSDLYLNVSGTSGGTQYTPVNYRIWRNLTQAPDLGYKGESIGALPISFINNILNSSICGGAPCSTSGITGKGWLALDAFDAATMNNHIAGVSFAFNPSLSPADFFGYNNNSNGITFVAPPTQTATAVDTINWNGPSAWATSISAKIVTVTASKPGSADQTFELPLIPGELLYKQVGF